VHGEIAAIVDLRMTADIGEFKRRHHRWLQRGGLLDRPWLFFASAPDPTLPASLPPNTAHVYIKFAAIAGRARGMAEPDLIFVNDYNVERQTQGLKCHRVLSLTGKNRKIVLDRILHGLPFQQSRPMHLSEGERDMICRAVLGSAFQGVGRMIRPSNGIALICYALLFDVPQIIVSGMSLTDEGHSNPGRKKFQRLHKEEDRASFAFFAQHHPAVMTSEPELAALTGLQLFKG
jgi:hypothetical protein